MRGRPEYIGWARWGNGHRTEDRGRQERELQTAKKIGLIERG